MICKASWRAGKYGSVSRLYFIACAGRFKILLITENEKAIQRKILNIVALHGDLFIVLFKQVAQRATIAHLSPMCQGQISFQKIYKWAMETRGPKSNSSELLCLSWLPATLMMIRSIRAVAGQRSSPELSFANKTKMFFRAKNKRGKITGP